MAIAVAVWLGVPACHSTPSAAPFAARDSRSRPAASRAGPAASRARPEVPEVADPVLGPESTLDDYLAYAALHNAGLEAAFNRWRAAVERVPQARALADPRLTYRYFIKEVETRVGPQQQGIGLAQVLPWFGKRGLRGAAASAGAEAERQRYEAIKRALFYEVSVAYNEYYYLGQALGVVQQSLDLITYLENVARTRYRTASASHPDVIRAQVELGRLEDQRASLNDLRGPVMARLNAALNRPADDELPIPESIRRERLVDDDAAILDLLSDFSPELLAMDHLVDRADRELALARKEYYPDLTIGVDYTDVGRPPAPAADPGFANPMSLRAASNILNGSAGPLDPYSIGYAGRLAERPSDSGQDIWMVHFSINLPIWTDKLAAGEREATARRMAAIGDRRQREHDLALRVKRALYEYRDADRKVALYRETLIPKARASIESTEAAFRAGAASFLELVDAERTLLEFELSHQRALANGASRVAELDMLVGTPLDRASAAEDPETVPVAPE